MRREAIAGTVHEFPLMANDVLYGAVIEGNHPFHNAAAGTPDVLSKQARFTSLVLYKDDAWKLARALRYAQTPAQAATKPAEVAAAPKLLDLLAGTYTVRDKMVLTVTPAGNRLMVSAGCSTFELYPTSASNFAMKERDIKVSFTVDAKGRGQGLVVRERGRHRGGGELRQVMAQGTIAKFATVSSAVAEQ